MIHSLAIHLPIEEVWFNHLWKYVTDANRKGVLARTYTYSCATVNQVVATAT